MQETNEWAELEKLYYSLSPIERENLLCSAREKVFCKKMKKVYIISLALYIITIIIILSVK